MTANNALGELLVRCARPQLRSGDPVGLAALVERVVDWDGVLTSARRHGLLPLMIAHLGELGELLPARVRSELDVAEMRHTARMLQITSELLRILRQLRSEGILAVPYKGPILSLQLYGATALRQPGDIDIVVRRSDVEGTRSILTAAGYRRKNDFQGAVNSFLLHSRYAESYIHPQGFEVELHWAFTNRDTAFPLRLEDLQDRLIFLELGSERVPAFAPEDLLLLLCVHGAKHCWDNLEHIGAVAETVRRLDAGSWDDILERAERLGIRRILALGLLLSHELMEAPLPPFVARHCVSDPAVVRLCEGVLRRLQAPDVVGSREPLEVHRIHYALRERRRDRVRLLYYRLTTPTQPRRWRVWEFGGHLIPVHAFFRPLQLVWQASSMLRRAALRSFRTD